MSDAERRDKARLRSERWRRAHGIGPRRPAQKRWLAEGCSRSTWYRRGNRVAKLANLSAGQNCKVSLPLARASAFVAQLQAELAEVARCQAVMAAIIGELSP